jgi:hypothetical protein
MVRTWRLNICMYIHRLLPTLDTGLVIPPPECAIMLKQHYRLLVVCSRAIGGISSYLPRYSTFHVESMRRLPKCNQNMMRRCVAHTVIILPRTMFPHPAPNY